MPKLLDSFNPDFMEGEVDINMKKIDMVGPEEWIPANEESPGETSLSSDDQFIKELEEIEGQLQKDQDEETKQKELARRIEIEKKIRQERMAELEKKKAELKEKRRIAAEAAAKKAEEERLEAEAKARAIEIAKRTAKEKAEKEQQHEKELDQIANKAVFDAEMAEEQAIIDEEAKRRAQGEKIAQIPIDGHFNVLSFHGDYYNRLISILASQMANYNNAGLQYPSEYYSEAAVVCQDLIRVISNSAVRFEDVQKQPMVALTIKDEDLRNLFIVLLAESYKEGISDEDYYSNVRKLD